MSRTSIGWSFVTTDSLEKVYTGSDPRPLDRSIPQSIFLGETAFVQVAFKPPVDGSFPDLRPIVFELAGDSSRFATLHTVELVPCATLAYPGLHDDRYDHDAPGLYPDLLRPTVDGEITPLPGSWRAVWVDLRIDDAADAGIHVLTIAAHTADGDRLFEDAVEFEVFPYELPPLDIVNTHWFHCDGLAHYYDVPVFSEEHWNAIDNFLGRAAVMGATSVLTPVWTPPLDTARDTTRTPVQLLDISYSAGRYSFGFEKLGRWLELCRKHGLAQVEIAHFFTQWGAEATPAIYVNEDNKTVHKFGWHVSATDPAYRELLEQLVPELRKFLGSHWPGDVIYHVSDEPHGEKALATYGAARAVIADLLSGCIIVDALSDFAFYQNGAVPIPVVATDALAPFLDAKIDDLWVYYCVAQQRDVANRFVGLPSLRNRVLGHQLFAFDVAGFLHWGFNFYNSVGSLSQIDPFQDTCAGGGFPAGDAFIVYPGPNGKPLDSIRFKVFAAAMQDHRAMQALRDAAGRGAVMRIIDTDGADGSLRFDAFSYDPNHYRRSREQINRLIAAAWGGVGAQSPSGAKSGPGAERQ